MSLLVSLRTEYQDRLVVKPSFVWALKRDYVREPAGSDKGGQFAKTGGLDPAKKETWLKFGGGGWHRSEEGHQPYGWETETEGYEVPAVTHKMMRGDKGMWGGSHYGSSVITGESAKQMGIDGYRDLDGSKDAQTIASSWGQAIADDATGSEEPLYHSFENTEHTVFKAGDTMDLPLTATAGKPETMYGTRLEHEDQVGPPTVFAFPKGTPMVAYGKWPTDPKQRGYEDGNAKEFGHVYSEAIVAGRFRVAKVETEYFGSMHSRKPTAENIQLYGQVVHLEPLAVFDPATKSWRPRG